MNSLIQQPIINTTRVWIDSDIEVFHRARKAFKISDIKSLEEYTHDKLKNHTDSDLTWVETNSSDFVVEMSYDTLYNLWTENKINPFN